MHIDKDMLREQYREANSHMRASDQKRDFMLGLYITLSVAAFGLGELLDGTGFLFWVLCLLLAIGTFLAGIFTMYRGWHGLYVVQAILLQKAIHSDAEKITIEDVINVDFKFNMIFSVELLMYLILIATLTVDLFLAYTQTQTNAQVWLIYVIAIGVMSVFIGHFIIMFYFDKLKKAGGLTSRYLWLLQGVLE